MTFDIMRSMSFQEIPTYLHPESSDMLTRIRQYFEHQNQPLERRMVFHLLEPLVGTSFLPLVRMDIALQLQQKKREEKDVNLTAKELFSAFMGVECDATIEEIYAIRKLEWITTTPFLPQHPPLPIDRLFSHSKLREHDMMMREVRIDSIYERSGSSQIIYSHAISQWTFYQDGQSLHQLPLEKLLAHQYKSYFDILDFNHIPEYTFEHAFFTDEQRPSMPALPKEQQGQRRGRRDLFVSQTVGEWARKLPIRRG